MGDADGATVGARDASGGGLPAHIREELREAAGRLPPREAALVHDAALAQEDRLSLEAGWALLREDDARHITVSGLLVSPDLRRTVLVSHRASGQLRQPGGHVDAADGGLRAALLREIAEECGAAAAAAASASAFPLAARVFRVGTERCRAHLDLLHGAVLPADTLLTGEDAAEWVRPDRLPEAAAPDLHEGLHMLLARF
ncbi:NUDIX domain-containing protein [Brevibacterium salitolerans]|uniref:NUDIX domain-containing protein n=1 Tax=Brevibacterium salitolerans TaxID=1403566 RepID=A0ABN2WBL0_9MICO